MSSKGPAGTWELGEWGDCGGALPQRDEPSCTAAKSGTTEETRHRLLACGVLEAVRGRRLLMGTGFECSTFPSLWVTREGHWAAWGRR